MHQNKRLSQAYHFYLALGNKLSPTFDKLHLISKLLDFKQFTLFVNQHSLHLLFKTSDLISAFNKFKNQHGLLDLQGFINVLKHLSAIHFDSNDYFFQFLQKIGLTQDSPKKFKQPKGFAFNTTQEPPPKVSRKIYSQTPSLPKSILERYNSDLHRSRQKQLSVKKKEEKEALPVILSWDKINHQQAQSLQKWSKKPAYLSEQSQDRYYLKQYIFRNSKRASYVRPASPPNRFSLNINKQLQSYNQQLLKSVKSLKTNFKK